MDPSSLAQIGGAEAKLPSNQMMETFGAELERYERVITNFEARLSPVLESVGPELTDRAPEEAPYHDLHNLILRLGRLTTHLDYLKDRVRL